MRRLQEIPEIGKPVRRLEEIPKTGNPVRRLEPRKPNASTECVRYRQMTMTVRYEEKVMTVVLNGRLDSTTAGEFDAFLEENRKPDTEKLVLDFADVDYISSKGLRSLVKAYRVMNGKPVVLRKPNAAVTDVLQLSGLLRYFTIEA